MHSFSNFCLIVLFSLYGTVTCCGIMLWEKQLQNFGLFIKEREAVIFLFPQGAQKHIISSFTRCFNCIVQFLYFGKIFYEGFYTMNIQNVT